MTIKRIAYINPGLKGAIRRASRIQISWHERGSGEGRLWKVFIQKYHSEEAPIGFSAPFVKQWITESGKTTGSLFDLTTFGMQSFFSRLQKETGLKTNAHVFRRSFAVAGRELGLDCLTIKDLGRWSSVDMVDRYTKDFSFNDANKLFKEKLHKLDNMFV
jgi:hypothetical protein